jgi:hypothetical protein
MHSLMLLWISLVFVVLSPFSLPILLIWFFSVFLLVRLIKNFSIFLLYFHLFFVHFYPDLYCCTAFVLGLFLYFYDLEVHL